MAPLLDVSELRPLVQTGLDDAALRQIIDREETEIIRRGGAHYVDASTPITETRTGGEESVYLRRPILSVTSVSETPYLGGTPIVLTPSQYFVWPDLGRLVRLPVGPAYTTVLGAGLRWGDLVTVVYVPQDDTSRRKNVLIELVRLTLERTAMKSENVAGEYSYTAPEWELARAQLYRSLGFMEV